MREGTVFFVHCNYLRALNSIWHIEGPQEVFTELGIAVTDLCENF